MFARMVMIALLLAAGSLIAADGKKADAPPPAADSKTPANVGPEILKFLETTITLKVTDMQPALALMWQLKLTDIDLTVVQTKRVSEKRVTFELTDVTLAEALRQINTKTGCQYRIVKNEIRMAMPEDWKDIDAGKVTFEKLLTPPEKNEESTAEKKK